MTVVEIPLRRRDGSVRAYSQVDQVDAARVLEHRWRLIQSGYAQRRAAPEISLHRFILGLTQGDGTVVDHINRNRLDNRRINLRIGTTSLNAQNRVFADHGASRHRGVTWHKQVQKWQAQAVVEGKVTYLGLFVDETEAASVAAEFRRQHMPFSPEARAA
jgi:HNH endonuclease